MKEQKIGEKGIKRYQNKAKKYVNDKEKARKLLKSAKQKADSKRNILDDAWENIQLVIGLFEDWITGRYQKVPSKSIIIIIGAIIYFVMPLDLLPDFFIGVGLIDDVAVIGFLMVQLKKDFDDYIIWKEENKDKQTKKCIIKKISNK